MIIVTDRAVKNCRRCAEILPLDFFAVDKKNRDGLKSWCKGCCTGHARLMRQRQAAIAKAAEEAEALLAEFLPVEREPVAVPVRSGRAATDDWRHQAACLGEDPELFFPIGNSEEALAQTEEAKACCRRCPSLESCLVWALDTNQDAGVWGGMSEDERRALKRRSARDRTRTTATDETVVATVMAESGGSGRA